MLVRGGGEGDRHQNYHRLSHYASEFVVGGWRGEMQTPELSQAFSLSE